MRRIALSGLCLAFAGLVAVPALAGMGMGPGMGPGMGKGHHDNRTVLSFKTMFGVDDPFVGPTIPIRGVPGDEAPWEIRSAVGFLSSSGHLVISVRGLVFKDDPRSPQDEIGKNDETEFRALVSCLSTGGEAAPTNRITQGFPTNDKGNAFINARIDLPNPCVAPIVMILAGSEDKWFAMTGVEDDSGN